MTEMRRDLLTGSVAIVAPVREARPEELVEAQLPGHRMLPCPFCAGNERHTPSPTLVVPHPSSPHSGSWCVRVVPNKYPAIPSADGPLSGSIPPSPLFECAPIAGGHEVIIESPIHVSSLSQLDSDQAGRVFGAFAQRLGHWQSTREVRYAVVFKNVGASAGASLQHAHSQLIATSFLPPLMRNILDNTQRHQRESRRCLLCELTDAESAFQRRVVTETDNFIVYCPYASSLPYQMRVVPKVHADRYEASPAEHHAELAALVRGLVVVLESTHQPASYNFIIHTRPPRGGEPDAFHWWLELFPRLTKLAGFEWASGCVINPLAPEAAAAHLRGLLSQGIC